MKKIIFAVIFTSIVVFTVSGQTGVIKELTGEVEIKPAGASAFVPATAGAQIALNTIVSTGFRSTAIIAIGSSLLTVRPLTRLSLAEIQSSSNTESVNVNLQAGRVKVDVKPPAGTKTNLKVQSPSATASVRGTSFEFDTVNLDVYEGRVVFGSITGAPAIVDAGKASFVNVDGTTADPSSVEDTSLLPQSPVGMPQVETLVDSSISNAGTGELSITLQYE